MKYPLAVAFDLDDTLYSERDYARRCLEAVARHCVERYGGDVHAVAERLVNAPDPYECARTIYGDDLTLNVFLKIYRATYPEGISLYNDAKEILDYLVERDIPVYLITDGRAQGQRNKIAALGLSKWFDDSHILVSAETGFDKLSPMPFAMAMSREADVKKWVYVGDNPAKDFRWPNQMGWISVMRRDAQGTNVHSQDILPGLDPIFCPQITIDKLNELKSCL